MKRLSGCFAILFLFNVINVDAQLYTKAFGDKQNPAIVFLHGGPGYNSFTFEASTAERLAANGYYVIVFDQRGCGRSKTHDDSNKYTFDEAIADVDFVFNQFGIKKATLIGHSWGGALGLMYAEKHPKKVTSLVLVGAPMDYQQTFTSIIANAKKAYTEQGKENQLKYLDILETMDKESLQYANYCFMQAFPAGLYKTKNPAPNAEEIKARVKQSPDIKQASNMTQAPVLGLYASEHYTTLNLYDRLTSMKKIVPVYGIYGTDDGLFDDTQLNKIKAITGAKNFTLVKDASHSVFMDQQDVFLEVLEGYIGK